MRVVPPNTSRTDKKISYKVYSRLKSRENCSVLTTYKAKHAALAKLQKSPMLGGAPPFSSKPTPKIAVIAQIQVTGFTGVPLNPAMIGTRMTVNVLRNEALEA